MAKFEKELNRLKEKLMTADDFSEVYDYFFDHLGENAGFIKMGKRAKNPILKKLLEMIGEQLFKEEGKVSNLLLTKISKPMTFYHGPCFINGRMGSVIFFKDIEMGMVSLVMEIGGDEVKFIRFSSLELDGSGESLFVNSPRSNTIH